MTKPRHPLRHLHAALTVAWLITAIPAVLWWRNSVAFVVFASVYANVVGHWSAWQATRAEEATNGTTTDTEADADA